MGGREVTTQTEWSAGQRATIYEEMEQILADRAFRSSKRCQALFRRVVEHALTGDQEGFKERTLGVEVFGRETDYDTATDPIVRMTANEIRKRLAQRYQESDRTHQVKIRLKAGAYLPQFDFDDSDQHEIATEPEVREETADHPAAETVRQISEPAQQSLEAGLRINWRWMGGVAIALSILAFVLLAVPSDLFYSRDYVVFKPLLLSNAPVTLCISDSDPLVNVDVKGNSQWPIIANMIASREAPSSTGPATPTPTTPLADADVAHKITGWLATHGEPSVLRSSSSVRMRDLRQGPVVLIGAFNPWSLILLSNLRFSIRVDPNGHAKWIQDSQNPSKRDWTVDSSTTNIAVDYAVVSRFYDTETGQWILAVGGLWPFGTEAASDLLTDRSFVKSIPGALRSNKNFQMVVKTSVINGSAGEPEVVAVYTW
jgi:hypothetical protein